MKWHIHMNEGRAGENVVARHAHFIWYCNAKSNKVHMMQKSASPPFGRGISFNDPLFSGAIEVRGSRDSAPYIQYVVIFAETLMVWPNMPCSSHYLSVTYSVHCTCTSPHSNIHMQSSEISTLFFTCTCLEHASYAWGEKMETVCSRLS